MKDKYVLDSNVWIEIERGNDRIIRRCQPLIQHNLICLVDLIAAEVLRGTRARRDYRALKAAFDDFPMISTRWERVAELAFQVARKGFQPPLVDLYIAQAVRENRRTLITGDTHFTQLARVRPLALEIL